VIADPFMKMLTAISRRVTDPQPTTDQSTTQSTTTRATSTTK
jgi:hypothetical protein